MKKSVSGVGPNYLVTRECQDYFCWEKETVKRGDEENISLEHGGEGPEAQGDQRIKDHTEKSGESITIKVRLGGGLSGEHQQCLPALEAGRPGTVKPWEGNGA